MAVPSSINEALRDELLAMAELDQTVRQRLADEGVLHEGYHPEMEAVHVRNAARLRTIMETHGWPSEAEVGKQGSEAAWLIVQHAIGEPDFQRACLGLLWAAADAGTAPAWQAAMLEDRVRMFEGRPQVYGSQLETGANGIVRPYWLDDPDHVEARRRSVGLEPLRDRLARQEPGPQPADPERFEQEYQAWLRRVGWRP
jgi:hypothetical protein